MLVLVLFFLVLVLFFLLLDLRCAQLSVSEWSKLYNLRAAYVQPTCNPCDCDMCYCKSEPLRLPELSCVLQDPSSNGRSDFGTEAVDEMMSGMLKEGPEGE